MRIVQVNFAFDEAIPSPEALLDRYFTLTDWGEAVRNAGAEVRTVQRFSRDGAVTRGGIEYCFRRSDRTAAAAVSEFCPDVVHVNGLEFPFRTWLLRRRLPSSAAIVVQAHSDPAARGRAPLSRVSGTLFGGAVDGVLVAAAEHAAGWRAAGLVGSSTREYQVMEASTRLRAVPRDAARMQTGIDGDPTILWVGRLNANKDPLTVLDGFQRALTRVPDAMLTMVYSTSELLPDVHARIDSSADLRTRVRLVGEVPHDRIAAFFSASDLFVVGSHHEGSGYSLMEACACGAIPVVADIPTFRTLTAAGSIGRLWKAGDAADCARALVDVAKCDLDAERRRVFDHFNRELSWEAVGKRAMDAYSEVIGLRAKS